MEPIMNCFDRWDVEHAGLFTFAQSPKHLHLYQKYGFWPRFLTAIMSKPARPGEGPLGWPKFSETPESEHAARLDACRELTAGFYPGLDVEREIRAVRTQSLGDTVLLWGEGRLDGFGVCHCGEGPKRGTRSAMSNSARYAWASLPSSCLIACLRRANDWRPSAGCGAW